MPAPGVCYNQRHLIENAFCRLKDFRRIFTRYDRLARNFLASVSTLVASRAATRSPSACEAMTSAASTAADRARTD